MHFHFHVPHFNVLPRHTTTHPADVEAGRRNITGPTLARKIDDVLNGASAYNFQPSGSPEVVKIYRLLPIFSGVMIPLSIMLSIPSLTGHWYIRTENNVTTEIRPNPLLLDVALGFSMAFAILASVFLVLRFAERCVKHMTLASIVLIALHGWSMFVCVVFLPSHTPFQISLIFQPSQSLVSFIDSMTDSHMENPSGSQFIQPLFQLQPTSS